MTVKELSNGIKKSLEGVQTLVRQAFASFLSGLENPWHNFIPEEDSIMTSSMFAVIGAGIPKIARMKSFTPLFNSLKGGSNFNRLAFAIDGYGGPTVILVRYIYTDGAEGPTHRGIFGFYTQTPWKDQIGYFGEPSSCLFRVVPSIKFMPAYKGKGGSSYQYMNTRKIQKSKYKAGLGLGGSEYKNYRVWLDDDILANSYTTVSDQTFPVAALTENCYKTSDKLNIDRVEVWGLSPESASEPDPGLEAQQEYRAMQEQMLENSRKIDKRKFVQGGYASGALAKTFAHRGNMKENIEVIKAEVEKGKEAS